MILKASFHQKKYWSWLLDHPWHPNDKYWSLFVERIIKNPIFTNIWYFSDGGCWGRPMLLFCQWWDETHLCPNLLKLLGTLTQENYWSFYPSEPFRIPSFNMRHPVLSCTLNKEKVRFLVLLVILPHRGINYWRLQDFLFASIAHHLTQK